MTILKLSRITTDTKKSYKVVEGVLFIDDDPVEITGDDIVTWDVSTIEDFNSIERNESGDVVIDINIYTDQATMNSFFSVVNKKVDSEMIIDDAKFPYKVVDGNIVWEADFTDLEGMEW